MQAQIARITHLHDVNRLLHDVVAQERACDAELDKMLCKRSELEHSLVGLNASATESLELVCADAEQLLGGLAPTAAAAAEIGGRVAALDAAAGRVRGALELVDLVLDRAGRAQGAQAAMAAGDLEAAAGHVAAFLELEARLAPAADALRDDTGQLEEQRALLMAAKQRLEARVAAELDDAVAAGDHARVMRFVKLYKPLGAPQVGVARYIAYARAAAGARARELYDALSEALDGSGGAAAAAAAAAKRRGGPAPTVDFVAALTMLLRELATAAERDEQELADTFGPSVVADVVLAVQGECDTHGVRVLQRFAEARRIADIAADAARHSGGAGGGPDARSVEPLVQELVALLQRAEEYSGFMVGKARAAITEHCRQQQQQQQHDQQQQQQHDQVDGVEHHQLQHDGSLSRRSSLATGNLGIATGGSMLLPEAATAAAVAAQAVEAKFRSGAFCVSSREFIGHYLSLEEYYMGATAAMALRIDTLTPGALTSSAVDDMFYLLKRCGARALATGSVQVAAALLGTANDTLAGSFKAALQSRLAGGPSRLVAAAPSMSGMPGATLDAAAQGAANEHAIAINNADVSADYAARLRAELEGLAVRVFTSTGERERIRGVLADLSKTGSDLRAIAARALEALADALLPRLRQALDDVGTANYLLADADYGAAEAEDGWPPHLLAALDGAVAWLRPRLASSAWEALFHSLLDKALTRLEVLLSRKAFTQLGGLQLDRDVRVLVAATGEMTGRTVRDKFARLTQMATVLSCESVAEFLEYWRDGGGVTWRLTPAEVRGVLAQRADFSRDVVAALPL